jgi:hypothetical protein
MASRVPKAVERAQKNGENKGSAHFSVEGRQTYRHPAQPIRSFDLAQCREWQNGGNLQSDLLQRRAS